MTKQSLKTMHISVIIPVFNRSDFLIKAVESAFNQTHQPLEVIIIDDGSTDAITSILQKIDLSLSRDLPANANCSWLWQAGSDKCAGSLRVLRQENKGVAAARNFGIKESKGEWLAFLDSDDYWLAEKLQKQVEFHFANPDILISQTDEIWVRNGRRINPNKPNLKVGGDIFEVSLDRCMISPSAVMLPKSLLDEVGYFDESLPVCEDYDLWLRICAKYKAGLISEKLVVKTGGHADQLSRKYWGMDRFRILALEKLLQNGSLSEQQKQLVVEKLIEKLTILRNGAQKRGREEAKQWDKKLMKLCL